MVSTKTWQTEPAKRYTNDISTAIAILKSTTAKQAFQVTREPDGACCASQVCIDAHVPFGVSFGIDWVQCPLCPQETASPNLNDMIVHLNDHHRLSFKEIAARLEQLQPRKGD